MADAQNAISLRVVATDEATPVIERVCAALADLDAGPDLGDLQSQLAALENALDGIRASSLGASGPCWRPLWPQRPQRRRSRSTPVWEVWARA